MNKPVSLVAPVVAIVAPLLVGACSSGASTITSSSCAFTTAPAAPAATDTSSVQSIAESDGLAQLDRFVGRYLRREAVLYRGTVEAHDDETFTETAEIAKQPAFAILTHEAGVIVQGQSLSDGMALAVHGTTDQAYIPFYQVADHPGTTWAGIILGDNSTGGDTAPCTDCAPPFEPRPETLAFENLAATAAFLVPDGYGSETNQTLHVTASVSLQAVEPCALSFDDLARAATLYDIMSPKFERQGDEMIAHVTGMADIPASWKGHCGGTAYTIDLYVNRNDLGDYGVKNFVAGATGVNCPA